MTLSERLRRHVIRLPDGHSTKTLCMEAAKALDPPALVVTATQWPFVCGACGEAGLTALDVCPECGVALSR